MTAIRLRRVILAAAALIAIPVLCHAEGLWIHIKVDSRGEDGERVRVNIPIELARSMMPIVEAHGFDGNDLRINAHGGDISKEDLRSMVAALREAPEGEYVTVDSKDEKVRIARKGNLFLIDVEDRSGYDTSDVDDASTETAGGAVERVKIRLRTEVLDALLSGEGDKLNIEAAIVALKEQTEGDIVSVEDGEETVRIWVDDENTTED